MIRSVIKRQQPGGRVLVGLQFFGCKLLGRCFQLSKRADAEHFLRNRIFVALSLGGGEFRAELLQLFAAFASPSQFTLTFTSSHNSI